MFRSPDRLFERYRRHGDSKALADFCDLVAPEVMRVAGFLIGDRDLAEDLTQETFLAAMRDAASWDRQRRVLPWLLGILANRARTLRRQRARQPMAERLAAPASIEPPVCAAAAEFEAALHDALDKLREPYAATLRAHLLDGRSASEIANQSNEPSGTVRMRLHRGMAQLRKLLPPGFVAATTITMTATGKAALLRRVLAEAGTTTKVTGATFSGGMKAMALVAILVGAVGLVGWSLSEEPDQAISPSTPIRSADSDTAPLQGGEAAGVERRAAPPAKQHPARTKQILTLRVLVAGTRQPVAGLRVTGFIPTDKTFLTDSTGRIQHLGRAIGYWLHFPGLAPNANHHVRFEPKNDYTATVELPIVTRFEVVVVDQNGRSVGGAQILQSAYHENGPVAGRTNSRGIWRSRSVFPSLRLRAKHPGHVASRVYRVRAAKIRQICPLPLRGPARRLRGMVLDPRGRTVPFAQVLIQEPAVGPRNHQMYETMAPSPVVVVCDQTGVFATDSAPRRGELLAMATIDGRKLFGHRMLDDKADRAQFVIQLAQGAVVTGKLPPGVNRALASISLEPENRGQSAIFHSLTNRRAKVQPDGRYQATSALPGRTRLQARLGNLFCQQTVELKDGQHHVWNPTFPGGGSLHKRRLRVFGPGNRPLADCYVWLRDNGHTIARGRTNTKGIFEFKCSKQQRFTVLAQPKRAILRSVVQTNLRVRARATTIRIPANKMPTARIHLRILPSDGLTLADLTYTVRETNSEPLECFAPNKDSFEWFRFAPGTYTLEIYRQGKDLLATTGPFTLGAGQTLDLGELRAGYSTKRR